MQLLFFLQYEKPRSSFDVSYPSDQNLTIMLLLFFYNMRNHGFPMTLVILLTKTLKLCNSSCFHRMRNHGLRWLSFRPNTCSIPSGFFSVFNFLKIHCISSCERIILYVFLTSYAFFLCSNTGILQ